MKLVAQRVVRPAQAAALSGVNAYCYLHVGRTWLGRPPADLGRGTLVNKMVEVSPPAGNRVRSYLEITTPDTTPDFQIAAAVQSGATDLAELGVRAPWVSDHGEVLFEFDAEEALAAHWQVELRLLLTYALAVHRS